jgi:hypothetical protein
MGAMGFKAQGAACRLRFQAAKHTACDIPRIEPDQKYEEQSNRSLPKATLSQCAFAH